MVPVEEATAEPGWVLVASAPRPGAHVRLAGEDVQAGGLVVPQGRVLRPAELGVLAAIGWAQVPVHPRPRVAVLTTGNELVDAGQAPGPGQIRDANIHSMGAQVRAAGALVRAFPRVPDRREAVTGTLLRAMEEADVVLTNGGVSVGDFDYIKDVLEDLGAEPVFWRVAQKPGGPLGLWTLGGKLVFGIPGNPVAAMIMVEEYVRPALRRMLGYAHLHRPERMAHLAAPWRKHSPDGRLSFLRVATRLEGGRLVAALTGPQGSGLLIVHDAGGRPGPGARRDPGGPGRGRGAAAPPGPAGGPLMAAGKGIRWRRGRPGGPALRPHRHHGAGAGGNLAGRGVRAPARRHPGGGPQWPAAGRHGPGEGSRVSCSRAAAWRCCSSWPCWGWATCLRGARLEWYLAAALVASVGSHMPSSWRHFSFREGRVLE